MNFIDLVVNRVFLYEKIVPAIFIRVWFCFLDDLYVLSISMHGSDALFSRLTPESP